MSAFINDVPGSEKSFAMISRLRTILPLAALVVGVPSLAAVVAVWSGGSSTVVGLAALSGAVFGLGGVGTILGKRLTACHRQMRQAHTLIERHAAMMGTFPGGYCVFSPQGLLREEVGVTRALRMDKLTHFEDLAAAVRETPDVVEAFRALQRTGEGFSLPVTVAVASSSSEESATACLMLTGRRFRPSRENGPVDILWLAEVPTLTRQMAEGRQAVALAEKHARQNREVFEAIPFPVWARTSDLRLAFVNAAYAKALDGAAMAILEGQTELMSPTAKSGSGRALAAAAVSRGVPQTERRHVIIGGKRRLLAITEVPLPDSSGSGSSAFRLVGVAVDVTAEEEKEESLKRHLAAYHEVLEHLGSPISVYGADTRLEFYNRAYQRLWDAEERFLNSKPTFGEVLEDLRRRRRAPEQTDFPSYKKQRLALFTSIMEPREDMMHLPDGTSLRILVVPHPFGGLLFVHEDVTDRLALESSYNTLMAVQRETLDNLDEGIAVFGPDGKLRLSNPSFARIWRLESPFLATNPHVADVWEQVKDLCLYGADWGVFKSERVSYALDRVPRQGKLECVDRRLIAFRTVPLPDGAVLNSYLDVTDTARVEQALRASNAALAAADRLKSDFVANVSYQLRTPLNTIAGFADILAEQYFGALNDKQMEYTQTIKDASQNLTRLINDVLDLATLEAGRMILDVAPVEVNGLLRAVQGLATERARRQALELVTECPSDVGMFEVDAARLKQALFNLVSNAITYTPACGRITLAARREGGWIILSVTDTGIGIPEADLGRVFGKFERANLDTQPQGPGLGLSLVKGLVELHGGRVEIHSVVGQGTTLRCFIPEHPPQVSAAGGNARLTLSSPPTSVVSLGTVDADAR